MSKKESRVEDDDELHLNSLTVPDYVAHVKVGNTLCANDEIIILQNGSTTVEVRIPPKLEPKKFPWKEGLIRDIAWCPKLGVFIFLTQNSLYTFNPKSIAAAPTTTTNTDIQLTVTAYSKIKPFSDKNLFWRCTCVNTTVFISYSGFGTTIDEYNLTPSSCNLVHRWTPPKTCGNHEGIWSIRYHPETDILGMSIMNGQNNQWRFELRHHQNLGQTWQSVLPISHGDCEISPLANGHWLAVNSCGIRLVQISYHKLISAVEYERELRNAIVLGRDYFIVRTKNTLEIHLIKKTKD